jgi:endonuclease/exonuclease/phosphatase (EEP) superfamily protein YafD
LLVAPWAAWAAVRALGLERGFPWVALIVFTPYVLPLAIIAGAVAAGLRRWLPAALAAVTVLVLALALWSRVTGAEEPTRGPQLRVLIANTHYGEVPPEVLARLVRRERVDVLSVEELTPALAPVLERELAPLLPRHVLHPQPDSAGTGLFSRFALRPIAAPLTHYDMTGAALRLPGAPTVRLLSVHVAAPDDPRSAGRWRADLHALPDAPPNGPVQILAGDFNATLDQREFRRLVGRGYRDAAEVVGAGLRPTWQERLAPPLTLDHVLAAERVAVLGVQVHDLPRSDHHAVLAELSLPAAG